MQDPETASLFCQWAAKPDQKWFLNYRQQKLQKENPAHPFVNKRWFNLSELSYKKNGRIKGRQATAAETKRLERLTVDIDTHYSLNDIFAAKLFIDSPRTTIIKSSGDTTTGAHWQFVYHLKGTNRRHFKLAEEIHRAASDLWNRALPGIDKTLIGDFARFDRSNLKQRGVINFKTGDEVEIIQEGYTYTLTDLRKWLEGRGYEFLKYQKFSKSLRLMRAYFNKNLSHEGPQESLAKTIGVPLRSFKYLIKKMQVWGEIDIKWKGNNTPGNPRRCYITSRIFNVKFPGIPEGQEKMFKSFKTRPPLPVDNTENKKNTLLSEFYRDRAIPEGKRNKVTFALTLEIKSHHDESISENEVFALLRYLYDYKYRRRANKIGRAHV